YYTLDGSEPDVNSIRYEGPFRIDGPTHIKSIAYRNGSCSDVVENYLYTSGNEPPVRYKLYLNTGDRTMPDFTKYGKPDSEGYISTFALDEFNLSTADYFSVLMTSNLVVPEEADYVFEVCADDGACLYVDGKLVVSNPNAHSVAVLARGPVHLTAGKHLLKVEYYEVTSTQGLYIRYSVNGGDFNPLFLAELER
ncbi:MAG: PA14 domain-containing protein, partial [Bacteroidales bacterium]|nr:PA14 domain-containing protein [Bacteroidales bacterium]